jgi:hypothetical protein
MPLFASPVLPFITLKRMLPLRRLIPLSYPLFARCNEHRRSRFGQAIAMSD